MANKKSVPRVCEACGIGFLSVAYAVKISQGKFCSRPCTNAANSRPIEERFWEKVTKDGPIIRPDLGPCWLWTAGVNDAGYGTIWYEGNNVRASRVSWKLHYGPISDGLWALHKCDNPPCVRPDHLFLGTAADNAIDCATKNRSSRIVHADRYPRKLTDDAVIAIRRAYASGETGVSLARLHSVSPALISTIVNRQRYTHLP